MNLCFLTAIVFTCFCLNSALMSTEVCSKSASQQCNEMLCLLEDATDKNYIGESVSQLAHALQCAQLAVESGADDETVLAALFHDIGHLCADADERAERNTYGVMNHDMIGADFLRQCGMSEKVCQLVLGHVEAKRYLTAIDPEYRTHLSDASKMTLIAQGDGMRPEEVIAFEQDPLFDEKILMRTWDEAAKVVDLAVPDLNTYRPLLFDHLTR